MKFGKNRNETAVEGEFNNYLNISRSLSKLA
uniref:Uncharacterized protein n=1 Tax=virus sp. ctqq75 TaxID=2827999 RepID=A0A8S5RE23_9VIRU|nr:MAG TPA: hypothetical protein [virus sp. ctqq75]